MLDKILWATISFGIIAVIAAIFSLPIFIGNLYEKYQIRKLPRYTHQAYYEITGKVMKLVIGLYIVLFFVALVIIAPV